jgi:hypothetical protein
MRLAGVCGEGALQDGPAVLWGLREWQFQADAFAIRAAQVFN